MTEFFNDKCSICLDPITCNDNLCKTICKHSFHSSCLAKHIYKKKTECPLCRSKLFDISEQEEEYDEISPNLDKQELLINKICNYLNNEDICFKDLITNLCFIEHEEFLMSKNRSELQNNSDFIFGKIRYIINKNIHLIDTNEPVDIENK